MALVPMFAGYVLFGWGLARIRASTATGISLLETVVAAVLAVLVVGERLPLHGWLGAAVVIFSLFILTPRKPAQGLLAPPAPAAVDTRAGQPMPAGQSSPPFQESSARRPLPPS